MNILVLADPENEVNTSATSLTQAPETTKVPETTKAPETTITPVDPSVLSSFTVHFIDVGQADAAFILCDGKSLLIDGGNVTDSDLIYTYLKKFYNITQL